MSAAPTATTDGAGASSRIGFILAGVQKGGTTTLFAALSRHRQIAPARPKELHFFDDERHDWSAPDYRPYERRIFPRAGARIAGEATPSYLFWPQAVERIHAYNPQMRLIFSFRDPIERAFSHWCMNKDRYPDATPDFSVAIREFAPREMPTTPEATGGRRRSYVVRGYYGAQLRRVVELFDAEQLLFLDFHRTFGAYAETIDRVTDFLSLDRFPSARSQKHRRAQATNLSGASPTAADIAFLVDLYRDDLAECAEITGIDVSSWSTARVARGDLDGGVLAAKLGDRAGLASHDPIDES